MATSGRRHSKYSSPTIVSIAGLATSGRRACAHAVHMQCICSPTRLDLLHHFLPEPGRGAEWACSLALALRTAASLRTLKLRFCAAARSTYPCCSGACGLPRPREPRGVGKPQLACVVLKKLLQALPRVLRFLPHRTHAQPLALVFRHGHVVAALRQPAFTWEA